MAADDLSKPLRGKAPATAGARPHARPGASPTRRPDALRAVNFVVAALIVAGLGLTGWLVLRDDPLGGEPVALVTLKKNATPAAGNPPAGDGAIRRSLEADDGAAGSDAMRTAMADTADSATLDEDGREVVRITINGALRDEADAAQPAHSAPARSAGPLARAPDPGLVERSKLGPLPRIGHDGRRPWQVYARRADPAAGTDASAPRIAIMVGALGISAKGTDLAIKRLPPAVSLAFAPYGRDLQGWVDKARRNGHEVLLQLPMEPFDYPDNDPGPHTLLTGASQSENVARLHWLMARMTGYFALTNYMGAKFSAAPDALSPVLDEVARRGLAYVDDGSSPRSAAGAVAAALGLPAGTGDVIIDAGQTRDGIAAGLARLERTAKARGVALGVASGLPASIEAIAEWAGDLRARGIILVPVSALVSGAPPS